VHYGPVDYLLLASYLSVRGTLLGILFRRGLMKEWPALSLLCVEEIVSSLTLWGIARHYTAYYYSYWMFSAVGAILSFGVLRDVVCAIPGTPFVPRTITAFIATVAGTITLVFVVVRYTTSFANPSLLSSVLAVNDGVQTSWYILFLALLGSISLFGFGWPKLPLEVASGFVWYGIASAASAHSIAKWPRYGATIDHAYCFVYISVFIFWCLCFHHKSTRSETSK